MTGVKASHVNWGLDANRCSMEAALVSRLGRERALRETAQQFTIGRPCT